MRMTRKRAEALRARRRAQVSEPLGCHYLSKLTGGGLSAQCRGGTMYLVEPGKPDQPTFELCPACNAEKVLVEARADLITTPSGRYDSITPADRWERTVEELLRLNRPATLKALRTIGPFQTFDRRRYKVEPVEWPWYIDGIAYRELVDAIGSGPLKRSDCGYEHPDYATHQCRSGLLLHKERSLDDLPKRVHPCPSCRPSDYLLIHLGEISEEFETGSQHDRLKLKWVDAIRDVEAAQPAELRRILKGLGAFTLSHNTHGLSSITWPWPLSDHSLSAHEALKLQAVIEDIDTSCAGTPREAVTRLILNGWQPSCDPSVEADLI
jgi:hypothetical protein